MLCSISIMTLIGCWRFMGMPTQNGVVTMGNNETMPLLPDSLLGGFTKLSESRISETTAQTEPSGTRAKDNDGSSATINDLR